MFDSKFILGYFLSKKLVSSCSHPKVTMIHNHTKQQTNYYFIYPDPYCLGSC